MKLAEFMIKENHQKLVMGKDGIQLGSFESLDKAEVIREITPAVISGNSRRGSSYLCSSVIRVLIKY